MTMGPACARSTSCFRSSLCASVKNDDGTDNTVPNGGISVLPLNNPEQVIIDHDKIIIIALRNKIHASCLTKGTVCLIAQVFKLIFIGRIY